ncbi:MAG: hypothetical protein AVDCRST_MAG02-4570, partial [uncultured Rubrobacteraceae bacterium]
ASLSRKLPRRFPAPPPVPASQRAGPSRPESAFRPRRTAGGVPRGGRRPGLRRRRRSPLQVGGGDGGAVARAGPAGLDLTLRPSRRQARLPQRLRRGPRPRRALPGPNFSRSPGSLGQDLETEARSCPPQVQKPAV